MDYEASIFALNILIPEKILRKHMPSVDLTDSKLHKEMAAKFGVNEFMLGFRIGQLSVINQEEIEKKLRDL